MSTRLTTHAASYEFTVGSGMSRPSMTIVMLLVMASSAFGQGVGIGEASFSPSASAMLEVRSTSAPYKGFLPPRLSTGNRTGIGSPATGLIVYDTDLSSLFYYDGGWIGIPGGSTVLNVANGGTGIASYTVGDLIYASGATTLSKLAGVGEGSYLRSGGVGAAPAWSAVTLPNAATVGDIVYGSGTNTLDTLQGNATTTRKALTQTGTGLASAKPIWVPLGHSGVTVYTGGSGNYVVPPDVTVIVVELVGGGGGAAGGTATANTNCAVGGGGGGGGYTRVRLDVNPGSSIAYAVGTGGAGSSTAVASPGTATTFSTYTANPGSGGTNMATGATVLTVSGGAGGAAAGSGDLRLAGGEGVDGFRVSGSAGLAGAGGASHYGSQTPRAAFTTNTAVNGSNGASYGSGGSGGAASRTGAPNKTATGGNGADGVIIIWEFK